MNSSIPNLASLFKELYQNDVPEFERMKQEFEQKYCDEISRAVKHYGLTATVDVPVIAKRMLDGLNSTGKAPSPWAIANDIVEERANRERTGEKCQCGSDAIGHKVHADWCPAIKKRDGKFATKY